MEIVGKELGFEWGFSEIRNWEMIIRNDFIEFDIGKIGFCAWICDYISFDTFL